MGSPSSPTFRLPMLWLGLDLIGIASIAMGLLIVDGVIDDPAWAGYGLPLCIIGALLMAFATVLILRAVLDFQRSRRKP